MDIWILHEKYQTVIGDWDENQNFQLQCTESNHVFELFEDAKNTMRQKIRVIATGTDIFDGNGHIAALDAYLNECLTAENKADGEIIREVIRSFCLDTDRSSEKIAVPSLLVECGMLRIALNDQRLRIGVKGDTSSKAYVEIDGIFFDDTKQEYCFEIIDDFNQETEEINCVSVRLEKKILE